MANLRVGTGITFDGATGNFNASGIGTVRGALNATSGLNVGTAITMSSNGNFGITGIMTATSFIGSGANLTGISAGIEMAQQWRLTSASQGNQTPLTNWESIDTYGQGNVGSSMSASSGVFTYPTTGIYLVIYFLVGYSDNHSQNLMGYIQHTTDNSSYNTVANGLNGIYDMSNSYSSWANTSTMYMFDITDTSNQKTRFVYGAGQGGEYVHGSSSTAHTTATFIRLAAT